jgi:two-component system, OmpR family, sensor kinase
MFARFFSQLYVRIWLAVVLAMAVLTLAFGWLLRSTVENIPPREVLIRNEAGVVVGQAMARPVRVPGHGVEFQVKMTDGSTLSVQMPPRQPRAEGAGEGGMASAGERRGPAPRSWLPRGPAGLFWILGLVGLAVALGTYPVMRHLTKRLQALRAGVQRFGEGDLSARVDAKGKDEVAFLAGQFNQSADRIERLVGSHKNLLANASHELRSPLARIRMGLELQEANPSEKNKGEISRSIAELDQLIDEILLSSRLDANVADVGMFETVDIVGLVAEECARAGVGLTTPAESIQVQGVPKLLRRALRNLLENAQRYGHGQATEPNAAITAQILLPAAAANGQAGRRVEIRVCDCGPGVPEDARERIFEPFYRLPNASEDAGGVGLGLALVKSIALKHGASVRCEAGNPHGACFVLALPRS